MVAVALAVALQGVAPEATARVDRAHVAAGEEVTLTVRARTRSAEPVTVVLPALAGFAILGSREVTEVAVAGTGAPVRTVTRELQLRAERPGALVIGPVRIRQGDAEVATAPLVVTVDSSAAARADLVSPLARRLVETAPPPPRGDQVALTLVVPSDSVLLGQQLDVVAAAWFPRALRARLRHGPIVTLQTPEQVWAYPGAGPPTPVASRRVRGQWMDVFAAHQVVFPLAPGRLVLPPAALQYALPATFSFFSREERYALRSDSVSVTVLPLPPPAAGARVASDAARVVAAGLTLTVAATPAEARVGEPIDVTAVLAGAGNPALWPEPAIRWPAGVRAYRGETGTRLEPRDGRIAGTKTFHYLVVPDSAGALVVPDARYPYYDIGLGAYATAVSAPVTVLVAPGVEPRATRALPALERGRGMSWSDAAVRGLAPWGWAAVLVVPPLVAWRRRAGRRRAAPASPSPGPALTRLGRLERQFHAVLASHVPDGEIRDGDGLGRALRAAGLESPVAEHVMRLRDRLRAVRYGPQGPGDATELATELEHVLRALGAGREGGQGWGGRERRRVLPALVVAAVAGLGRPGAAQAPGAEVLYEAGALRAAADSFAARAAAEPRVAAHWYNLGATLYRAGADGKATAAWTLAARLAPRDRLIRRARALLPPPDAASERLLAVGPLTPGEWALAAGALWIACWAAVAMRGSRVVVAALALGVAVAAALGWREARRYARPVAVILDAATPLRVAPYGGARAPLTLDAGAAVRVERRWGAWYEVGRADGVRGWVRAAEVVRL